MGKGHKHMKKLKSERAKVKLRASKHLPKGTNITDTSFKIKKIVIREQLKANNETEPLSRRKLNIKELLTRTQHYNTTVRNDAVSGLRELVAVYQTEIVQPNLNQLLQGVSHLALDKEKLIRRESFRLLTLILTHSTEDQIHPFFDILSSYLRCAMTHIDSAIQEDSLLLLDVLLGCVPSLVAKHSNKILDNFFDLISKLRSDSKPDRTLTVNLGSKITAVKWRIKVLNRLYQILNAIMIQKTNNNSQQGVNISRTVKFNSEISHIPVYNGDVSFCSFKLNNGTKNMTTNISKDDDQIAKYIEVLIPLLFETWQEVGPNRKKAEDEIESTLSAEAAEVLNCILGVFQLLWMFIKLYEKNSKDYKITEKFISKYARDFSTYLVECFPYSQLVTKKRKRKEKVKSTISTESCICENLMICYLFCVFYKDPSKSKQERNSDKILTYIRTVLKNWDAKSDEQNNQLILILRIVLLEVSNNWLMWSDEIKAILNSAIELYDDIKLTKNARNELFSILCEIVHNMHLKSVPNFQIWLSNVPNLLCNTEISANTVDLICTLAKQKNAVFENALAKKFNTILSNISILNITDCSDDIFVKNKIISLSYFLPSQTILSSFRYIQDGKDAGFTKYFKELILCKYRLTDDRILKDYMKKLDLPK